jgi:hypothetical protein
MKTVEELKDDGLDLLAYSSDGAFKVTSYIALRGKRRVYGAYHHQIAKYIEVSAPRK